MGFIEEIRANRQREAEVQQKLAEASLKEGEFKKRKKAEKSDWINKQRQLSASYIGKSTFWELTTELSRVLGSGSDVYSYGQQSSDDDANSYIVLQWDRHNNNSEGARDNWYSRKWDYAKKQIRITFTPDGSVFVSGKETYSLSLNEWIDKPKLQEQALEKAYGKPLLLQDDSGISEPTYPGF